MPSTPTVAKPDSPVTHATLLEALSFLIKEVGVTRAESMTTDQLSAVLERNQRRDDLSNPRYPRISAFSYPEGDLARPKPELARETWVNSAKVDPSQITPFELLAFNALSDSLAPGGERTTRGGRWQVKVSANGQRMMILIPCQSIEDRAEANATSVGMFCEELARGTDAVTPETMYQRIAALEAQVASLGGSTKAAAG